MATNNIKTMQLYHGANRILADLEANGIGSRQPVTVEALNQFDQLHYHGTKAIDAAIFQSNIKPDDKVLEVGSGWGGCARYIAHSTGAHVTAVELQSDYNQVARDLSDKVGLSDKVAHINADFLELETGNHTFDHAVSWLALFHIPNRETYLRKLNDSLVANGTLFVEDLYLRSPPTPDEAPDFQHHLHPNSLVPKDEYLSTLSDAGFDISETTDMTEDWTVFTGSRLQAFRQNRENYEAIHGAEGYTTIETFYDKMAGYFQRGLVGGLRLSARRRG